MCARMSTFNHILRAIMVTLKNNFMKKILYESPWADSLPLETSQSICDLSMEKLIIVTAGFDDDSD